MSWDDFQWNMLSGRPGSNRDYDEAHLRWQVLDNHFEEANISIIYYILLNLLPQILKLFAVLWFQKSVFRITAQSTILCRITSLLTILISVGLDWSRSGCKSYNGWCPSGQSDVHDWLGLEILETSICSGCLQRSLGTSAVSWCINCLETAWERY